MYKISNNDNFSYLSILREIVLHYYTIELKKCNSEIGVFYVLNYINVFLIFVIFYYSEDCFFYIQF